MRKETWPNYKNINKHSYKTSHSIYMETDKDKSHLTKLFTSEGKKRGEGYYFTSEKMAVIPDKGKDIR